MKGNKMSEYVREITDFEFDGIKAGGVTLVDFWAPWCGPCQMQGPVLDKVGSEYAGKAVIAKINVDEQREKAEEYGVMSIPTLILFKDGNIIRKFTGLQDGDTLGAAIRQAL